MQQFSEPVGEPAQLLARAEVAEAAEAKFRGLLEFAPDAIVITDPDGRITLVNRQAEQLTGYTREELVGRPVEDLLPESLRSVHVRHRANYMTAPRTRPMGAGMELAARRRDGTEIPVEISLSPVMAGGELLVMAALRDITERRQAEEAVRRAKEEAERANRAKSEFLSRMSHELRTPLNAVLGFAQLLAMDELTPQQQRNVARIVKAGRHLLELINEVLDIARIETGRLPLSPEPVRLADAVREALDLVRPLAAERQVTLDGGGSIGDGYVLADRQRLKQVFLNLLSNAIKYNRAGGIVTIACTPVTDGFLRVSIRDTGHGIAPEHLDRLFQPFDRLGAEATGIEGTGLGLALAKGLVEAMGGRMHVDSTLGVGSTFAVDLVQTENPLHTQAEVHASAAATSELPPSPPFTILYVEDNLSNLELIEQVLARRPQVQLLAAMQGRLGLELALRHLPDLVLLDLHLPDLSGLDVLHQLKEDDRTRAIPVVIVTADATRGQVERLRAAGAREYLTKPFDVPRFLELIDSLIRERHP